jgi:phage-related protein
MSSAGYDGSIRIDTRVNTNGFNAGIKKITTSAGAALATIAEKTKSIGKKAGETLIVVAYKVGGAFKWVGSTLLNGFKKVLGIVTGIMGILAVGIIFGNELLEKLTRDIDKTSKYNELVMKMKDSFNGLKGALLSVFATLLTAAMPIITKVINWLTTMLNKLNMIIAAWLGQKTVLQAVVTSTAQIAKNNEKSKKAAQGALAAFDQINVLQKSESDSSAAENALSPISFKEVPIDEGIAQKVADVKGKWIEFVDGAKTKWQEFKDFIFWDNWKEFFGRVWEDVKIVWANFIDFAILLWNNFIDTWTRIFANTSEIISGIKENIIKFFNGIKEFITGVFTGDWALAWQGIKDIVSAAFDNLWLIIKGTITNIGIFLSGWGKALKIIFEPVLQWLEERFVTAKTKILAVWESIKLGFQNAFGGIKDFAKNSINSIIDFINRLVQGVVSGINTIINAANGVGTFIPGFEPLNNIDAPKIPKLATGAVIPPNAAFAAILGDQRNGKNLEAPEGLIRQIIREEMQGGIGGDLTVSMPVYLDGQKIYENQKRIQTRQGRSLLKGGVA